MLEIFKPAPARAIDFLDDRPQAATVRALGLGPDRILEPLEALLPRPLHIAFKVVSHKVESSFLGRVHNPRLYWMQLQTSICRPLPHQLQRLLGLFLASAQNQNVVRIPHHLDSPKYWWNTSR